MKVGDLVKFSEEFYPEWKGKIGLLVEKKAASGPDRDPMWQVMVDGTIHSFYVPSEDLEVIGYDDNKMIGGRL